MNLWFVCPNLRSARPNPYLGAHILDLGAQIIGLAVFGFPNLTCGLLNKKNNQNLLLPLDTLELLFTLDLGNTCSSWFGVLYCCGDLCATCSCHTLFRSLGDDSNVMFHMRKMEPLPQWTPKQPDKSPWGGLCRARVGLQAKRCHTLMPLVPRMFTQVRRDCIANTDLLLIYVFFPSVHQQPVLSKITSGHYDLSTKSKTLQCILVKASSWAIPRKGEAGNILWGKMPLNSKHLHTD